MNQLDILPQNMPSRAEAQSSRTSGPLEGKVSGRGSSTDGSFDSLLNGLTDGARPDATQANTDIGPDAHTSVLEPSPGPDQAVIDFLQTVMTDVSPNSALPSQGAVQIGSSVLAALEGLLPRVPTQENSNPNARQTGSDPLHSGLNRLGHDPDGSGVLSSSPGAKLQVAVQHQETHFRPIVEELSLKGTSQNASLSEEETPKGQILAMPTGASADQVKNGQPREAFIRGGAAHAAELLPTDHDSSMKEQAEAGDPSLKRDAARLEMPKQIAEAGSKTDNLPLPPATLHRIAGAVLSEVRSMAAELNARSLYADGTTRLTSARASDGVLRLLHLQLHPAELGLVTIKMRLAGDSLEMELQVSSEETAQLLRNDTEKLSGLLRGSGYRPDVISVHTSRPETGQQEGAVSNRQPSQSQQQAFHQGASHQEGRFRHQDDRYKNEGTRARNDADEDGASLARSAGGIYL